MIFYFTATGNSFAAVEKLRADNEQVISIGQSCRDSLHHFDAKHEQSIGFVFPVYFFGIPHAVAKFVHRLELLTAPNPYIYVVFTCGGATGQAGKLFKHALATKGLTLSAQFAVKMPNNYIPMFSIPPLEKRQRMLIRAATTLTVIHQEILHRATGDHNHCKGLMPALFTKFFFPRYDKTRLTKKFKVSSACDACGHCANICPDKAITIQDKQPVWTKPQCTLCLACVHRCPKHALDFGSGTRKKERYVNTSIQREKLSKKA